jgi:hypothetical protein
MLFSCGGCTQGFNTFLTALKLPRRKAGSWVLNPFGTNKIPGISCGFPFRIQNKPFGKANKAKKDASNWGPMVLAQAVYHPAYPSFRAVRAATGMWAHSGALPVHFVCTYRHMNV